jgi:hypothetical protein
VMTSFVAAQRVIGRDVGIRQQCYSELQ